MALGLADPLRARGVPVFGPNRAAAELEWSKAFAKDFMRRHGIPTAAYASSLTLEAALEFARSADYPLVVKADGLAAGKGVLICGTSAEAEAAIRSVLVERAFGAAGDRVVIEEFLEGEELSVIALVDGERIADAAARARLQAAGGRRPWAEYRGDGQLRSGDRYLPGPACAMCARRSWSQPWPGCGRKGDHTAARSTPG